MDLINSMNCTWITEDAVFKKQLHKKQKLGQKSME